MTINIKGNLLDLTSPLVMGILNVTPDSFYDGGRYTTPEEAVVQTAKMLDEGASIIDIGAVSTKPGNALIQADEEVDILKSIFQLVRAEFPKAIFSVDTYNAQTAYRLLDMGADMINDVSGGRWDSQLWQVVKSYQVPYILTHSKGTPTTMQQEAVYNNLLIEMNYYFSENINKLHVSGINDILIDVGFGFAKNLDQNYELMNQLEVFHIHEKPLVVGVSRKSMVYKLLQTNPEDALIGSSVLHSVAIVKQASILRVHDVKEAMQVIRIVQALAD